MHQRLSMRINLRRSGSELPCVRRSLTLTQSAAWSCLLPHSSPSGDGRGCDSPKRSTFLAGPRTWYLGGRASLAGTLSCRWLRADRPCSPTPGLPPCRFGICTRHSVPRPPDNVAWRAPRWCTWPEEWTVPARASQISSCLFSPGSSFWFFGFFFFFYLKSWSHTEREIMLMPDDSSSSFFLLKSTVALIGAVERSGNAAACRYFRMSCLRQRLAPIWDIRSPPPLPGWWGVSTSEFLLQAPMKGSTAGQAWGVERSDTPHKSVAFRRLSSSSRLC